MRLLQRGEHPIPAPPVVEAGSLVFHLIVIAHIFGVALGLAIVIAGLLGS